MDLFHCLYEIQEEEYAKRIIDNLQSILLLQPTYTKMDIRAMSFCIKSSHSHLSLSLKCQHLLGFEEEKQALAFIPPTLTPNHCFKFSGFVFMEKAYRLPGIISKTSKRKVPTNRSQ